MPKINNTSIVLQRGTLKDPHASLGLQLVFITKQVHVVMYMDGAALFKTAPKNCGVNCPRYKKKKKTADLHFVLIIINSLDRV